MFTYTISYYGSGFIYSDYPFTNFIVYANQSSTAKYAYYHLQLADLHFYKLARIDMLIGCNVFPLLDRPQSNIKHTTGLS